MPRVSRGWVRVRLAVHAVVGLNLFCWAGLLVCDPALPSASAPSRSWVSCHCECFQLVGSVSVLTESDKVAVYSGSQIPVVDGVYIACAVVTWFSG